MMKKRPHERPRHRGPSRRHRIRLRWHADAVCAARSRRLSLRRLRWLTRRRRRHARARAGRIDAGDRCAAGLLGRLPRHRGTLQPRADRAAGSGHPRHPAVDDLRELSRRHAPGSSQPGPGRGVGDALRPQLPLLRGSVHPAFHAELLYQHREGAGPEARVPGGPSLAGGQDQHRGPDDPRAGRLLRELSRDPGAREVRGGVPVGPAVAGHLIPHSRPTLVEEDAQAVARIVRGGILAQGPEVAGFERALAERLGTGEGGLVGGPRALVEGVRAARDYDEHVDLAPRFNAKLTDLQAALGRSQLARFDGFLTRRRAIAARYRVRLAGLPCRLPADTGGRHVYHRFVIEIERPVDQVIAELERRGIAARRPVFRPIHRALGLGGYPEAERLWARALSLPCYPSLSDADVDTVAAALTAALEE